MSKSAISVSLQSDNLVWLRGRALAAGGLSVSATLDRLIQAARGGALDLPSESIAGAVRIAPDDPERLEADAAVRRLVLRTRNRASAGPSRRPAARRRARA